MADKPKETPKETPTTNKSTEIKPQSVDPKNSATVRHLKAHKIPKTKKKDK